MQPNFEKIASEQLDLEENEISIVCDWLFSFSEQIKMFATINSNGKYGKYKLSDFQNANIRFFQHLISLSEEDRLKASLNFLRVLFVYAHIGIEEIPTIISTDNSSPESSRNSLMSWLSLIEPLISYINETKGAIGLNVYDVQIALSALNAGELASLFQPSKRKGKEINSYTLAEYKLYFALLGKELKLLGVSPKIVNDDMATASGQRTDTSRKWESAALAILSPSDTERIIRNLRHTLEDSRSDRIDLIRREIVHTGSEIRKLIGYHV